MYVYIKHYFQFVLTHAMKNKVSEWQEIKKQYSY